eukprot:6213556-Pleurochrysis_carterae.AAC.3
MAMRDLVLTRSLTNALSSLHARARIPLAAKLEHPFAIFQKSHSTVVAARVWPCLAQIAEGMRPRVKPASTGLSLRRLGGRFLPERDVAFFFCGAGGTSWLTSSRRSSSSALAQRGSRRGGPSRVSTCAHGHLAHVCLVRRLGAFT